jgi:hypothetical protein
MAAILVRHLEILSSLTNKPLITDLKAEVAEGLPALDEGKSVPFDEETKPRQAQRLDAMGTPAGGIAHDFNNILGAILGYGEMAQRSPPAGLPP